MWISCDNQGADLLFVKPSSRLQSHSKKTYNIEPFEDAWFLRNTL